MIYNVLITDVCKILYVTKNGKTSYLAHLKGFERRCTFATAGILVTLFVPLVYTSKQINTMELNTNSKNLFQLLSDQLLVSTGCDLSNELLEILNMAKQSKTWGDIPAIKKENLSFQAEQLCEFLKELDSHTERIHAEAKETTVVNSKQLRYA